MNQGQISVIIPVYKVEEYLEKCIQSVQEQTYSNLQIILVDDGSPDSCGSICDMFAKTDQRITVVHKENGGLSDARNAGLSFVTGEFVFYLDSDDYLEKAALSELISIQQVNQADIVVGNYFYTYETHEDIAVFNYKKDTVLNNYDAMEALVTGKIQNFAWGKLIKTDIAEKYLFPKGKLFEDNYWAHLIFGEAERVVITNVPLVHYRQRENSISYTFTIERLDIIEGWLIRKEYLEQHYPELTAKFLKELAYSYTNICWSILTRMKKDKQQAFGIMKKYNCQLQLEKFAQGKVRVQIDALNKSVLGYLLVAVVCKVLEKLGK